MITEEKYIVIDADHPLGTPQQAADLTKGRKA